MPQAWRPLARCFALMALAAAAPVRAEPFVRYDATRPSALVVTGNTLGLAGEPEAPAALGRVGAFTDASLTLQVAGWPLGTTDDWALASSEALLDLPAGATVLFAELVWGGSVSSGIVGALDGPVTLTTPDGVTWDVPPRPALVPDFGGANGTRFYGRSADVSALVGSGGVYRVGTVPAALEVDDAAAGWTLHVVYHLAEHTPRRVSIMTVMELVGEGVDPARVTAALPGLCIGPEPTRDARIVASALDGDAEQGGDSLRLAALEEQLDDDDARVGDDDLPPDNLFGGRITDGSGALDARGTFGDSDHGPASFVAGARQGWDLVQLAVGARLDGDWRSAWLRASDEADRFGLVAIAVALAVRAPHLLDDGQTLAVSPPGPALSGAVTLAITLDNVGDADALAPRLTLPALPAGVSYVPKSLHIDGEHPPDGAIDDAAALTSGVVLPTIAAGAARVLTLALVLSGAPGTTSYTFAPTVRYANGACPDTPAADLSPAPLSLAIAPAVCGDRRVDPSEGCDDGDRSPGDGCDGACAIEPGWECAPLADGASACHEICGDGRVVGAEVCDDGRAQGPESDGCAASCRGIDRGWLCLGEPSVCRAPCGDGIVAHGAERCDDGNERDGDGCAADCGAIEVGFTCAREPSVCGPVCGDGRRVSGEGCDDGNAEDGDGCSATCRAEAGWVCVASAPGDDTSASRCRRDSDGDGVVDDGDDSGDPFDNPCPEGSPIAGCDDNCPDHANPDQSFPSEATPLCPPYRGPRTHGGGGCAGGGSSGAAGCFIVYVLSMLHLLRSAASRAARRGRWVVLGALALGVVAREPAPVAAAEVDPRLIAPALSPLGVVGVSSSATSLHLRPWVNMVVSLADDELTTRTGSERHGEGALDSRLTMTFAAGFGLFDRLDLALGLPVVIARGAFQQDGDMGLGDLRVSALGRLLGPALGGQGPGLALALQLTLPTGSQTPFMSDGAVTALPEVVLDYRTRRGLIVALNLGVRLRPERTIDDLVIGDELRFGLGAEIPVGFYGFAFLAELDAALSLAKSPHDGGGFSEREAPVELVGGLRWRSTGGITLSGAVGGGLSEGYGAPDFRVVFAVAFNVPPPDRFVEPIVPASRNELRDDWDDGVPHVRGPRGSELGPEPFDRVALADPDPDSDGVPTPADVCPEIAEDRDGFQDDDGCPDPDDDGDGVLDADDLCPDELETLNGNADFDGCHDEPIPIDGQGIKDERVVLRDAIRFAAGSDELLESDRAILDEVVVVIRANPEIAGFRVEAHTDDRGDREKNVDLSERRAWRVRDYLVDAGVDAARLFAKGFGPTRPLADNRGAAGRAKNQRVEIIALRPGEASGGEP